MMGRGDENIYGTDMVGGTEASRKTRERAGDRGGRDAIRYERWIARGLMGVYAGNIIDKRCAIAWLDELRNDHHIYSIMFGYDRYHMGRDEMSVLKAYHGFFGENNCYPIAQGRQTLSQPMKELKAIYKSDGLVANSNPIAEWFRSIVMNRHDENGE